MIVLKLCGITLIIASTTGIGFFMCENMHLRLEALNELKKILSMLRGEIRYTSTPLYEAFGVIGKRTSGAYSEFFIETSKELAELNGKSLRVIWNSLKEKYKQCYLSDKDWERFMQFGDDLGYLDKEMQLGTIDLYIESIETEITMGYECYNKNSRLYRALGLCAGLFLAIILI